LAGEFMKRQSTLSDKLPIVNPRVAVRGSILNVLGSSSQNMFRT